MRRMLLICPGFPPEDGGGTIRVAKLAKYLPAFGWSMTVVTAQPPKGAEGPTTLRREVLVRRAPRFDLTGALVAPLAALRRYCRKEISSSTGKDGPGMGGPPSRRLAEYFMVPDDRVLWVPLAVLAALWAWAVDGPEVVYSTSPSASAHLIGLVVKGLTRTKWIIEFRDPWTFNPFRIPRPFSWMERLERWMERCILRQADHVVVTSEAYRERFLTMYPELQPEKFSWIPNGFDPEDFEKIERREHPGITLVHAGTFYAHRSPLHFLEGLALALAQQPHVRRILKVRFLGPEDPMTPLGVVRWGLEDVVVQAGKLNHKQCIEAMVNADLLLLIPGPGEGTIPGKLYEYFAAKRPILCLADEGASRALVISLGLGVAASPEDPEGIAACLLGLVEQVRVIKSQGSNPNFDQILLEFDRRRIAQRTGDLLAEVASGKKFSLSADVI